MIAIIKMQQKIIVKVKKKLQPLTYTSTGLVLIVLRNTKQKPTRLKRTRQTTYSKKQYYKPETLRFPPPHALTEEREY